MNITQIKEANKRAGFYFFSKDSVRFFRSKALPTVYKGNYFITSESDFSGENRFYTVRVALLSGDIETVGSFGKFADSYTARGYIKKLHVESHYIIKSLSDLFNGKINISEYLTIVTPFKGAETHIINNQSLYYELHNDKNHFLIEYMQNQIKKIEENRVCLVNGTLNNFQNASVLM